MRVVRTVFLGANVVVVAYLGWRWTPVFLVKDRLMVIDCPFPGAEVYLKDRKLGSTLDASARPWRERRSW